MLFVLERGWVEMHMSALSRAYEWKKRRVEIVGDA